MGIQDLTFDDLPGGDAPRKTGIKALSFEDLPSAAPEAATRPEFNLPFGLPSIKTNPNESGFNLPAFLLSAGQKVDALNQGVRQAKLATTGTVYQALGLDNEAQKNAEAQYAQSVEEAQKAKRAEIMAS